MENCHILVVEDDPDINRLLCTVLGNAGYDRRPAFSGSEATWATQYNYDLVLLDLMLPGLTGEEFIQKMRRKKTMPILVLSAKAGLEDRVNVLRLERMISSPSPLTTRRSWPGWRPSCGGTRSFPTAGRGRSSPTARWSWTGRA